jgi:parallel beta-helix repeat protein
LRVSGANAAPYALGSNIWGIAAGRKGPASRGLRIEKNEIINSAGDGIHLEGVQESVIDSNLVANNENVGIQIYRSVEPFPVADVTVSNNEVHHNHFIGINMAQLESSSPLSFLLVVWVDFCLLLLVEIDLPD